MSEASHIRRLLDAFLAEPGGDAGELAPLIQALALHTIQQMEEKEALDRASSTIDKALGSMGYARND